MMTKKQVVELVAQAVKNGLLDAEDLEEKMKEEVVVKLAGDRAP